MRWCRAERGATETVSVTALRDFFQGKKRKKKADLNCWLILPCQ